MTNVLHFPGPAGPRPDVVAEPAISALAIERASFAAHHAAQAQQDTAHEAELARADAEHRARVEAAVGIAAAAAERAAGWVEELADRTGSRRLAKYADAVLACGRDLDPEDDENGGLNQDLAFVLSGLVLAHERGLTEGEGLRSRCLSDRDGCVSAGQA
ncbi:hypothetical protein ACGF13_39845 [Kitasatospora sp. NPDC048286]|uniref:hypothetical protein n=1 Tax=Kitasatospora sp. NPDC048286 TaxID=3364047 RepID=UPI00371EC169